MWALATLPITSPGQYMQGHIANWGELRFDFWSPQSFVFKASLGGGSDWQGSDGLQGGILLSQSLESP